jgi:hypothetical protein
LSGDSQERSAEAALTVRWQHEKRLGCRIVTVTQLAPGRSYDLRRLITPFLRTSHWQAGGYLAWVLHWPR